MSAVGLVWETTHLFGWEQEGHILPHTGRRTGEMVMVVSIGFTTYRGANLCLQAPPASAEPFLELQLHASTSPAIKSRLNSTCSGFQPCHEEELIT